MSGDYWIYVDGEQHPRVEVDLLIRPMEGERIWFRFNDLDHEVEVTQIIHVTETPDDYARVEVHTDLLQTIDPEEEDEEDEEDDLELVRVNHDGTIDYTRCERCHGHEFEEVHSALPDDTTPLNPKAVQNVLQKMRTGEL